MISEQLLGECLGVALSAGGDFGDVFYETTMPLAIQMEDGKVEKYITGLDSGVGIRVVYGGNTAYGYTNDLDAVSLLGTARTVSNEALSAAKGARVYGEINLTKKMPANEALMDFKYAIMPDAVPSQDKIALMRKADKAARKFGTRIKQVNVVYSESLQRVVIATNDTLSAGTLCEDERLYTVFSVNVVAEENGCIQTGYETIGGLAGFEILSEENVEALAVKAADRAIRMLSAPYVKGGRMAVVISSEAGGTMVHEAIGHGLEADLAGEHLSVYSGKMGETVASPLITVIDDGTIRGKRGSFRFDDEGTPSGKNVLVSQGVLTGYMYDRINAMKDGAGLTGNGRRESYRSRPIPRMTNTCLAPGKSSAGEILRVTPDGLFVRKMGGGQVNTATGDFVFDVQEAYIIKNGTLGDPVRGATLCGNGPNVLGSIDMIADDLGFSIGTCGKDGQGVPVADAMPTLRIPEIVVGGKG
ncbi:MAG: TldD/PmbA family protein [Nitrospirae bacterium]|nr:TldD/PmbA family protein [Nitrospirota bacterium]